MATRLSHRSERQNAGERAKKYPQPTAAEWRELYEWDREINQRIIDGSIHDLPPVREQLAEHVTRLGL